MDRKTNSNKIKQITLTGMLGALSLVLGYIESLIPLNIGIPGVKPGLANTVVLYAVCLLDVKSALALVLIKVLLSAFIYAGASSIIYSLAGGLLSLVVMLFLKRKTNLGIAAVSMSGAVAHNIGQIAAACLMLQSFVIVTYLPVLLFTGIITGFLTGIIASLVISRLGYKEKKNGIKTAFAGVTPVLSAVLLIGMAFLCVNSVVKKQAEKKYETPVVVVTLNGKEAYRIPLAEQGSYSITDEAGKEINRFIIDGDGVRMESSTCKNDVCVHIGSIHPGDNPIVCVPNRVVVRIDGGTADSEKYSAYSFDYFDTSTEFTAYIATREEFESLKNLVFEKLDCYNTLFDCYEESESVTGSLAALNVRSLSTYSLSDSEYVKCTVSDDVLELLEFGKEMYSFSKGKVDISLGKMLSLWHEERTNGLEHPEIAKVPDLEALKAAAELSGTDKIVIDRQNGTVSVPRGFMIDTGAIAKGFVLDKAVDMLKEQGTLSFMLNIGGNVYATGSKDDGTKWSAGIENPLYDEHATGKSIETKKYLEVVELDNRALATSGSYQRFYEVDNKRYHHIIDPETLMPENRWLSVSVLSSEAGIGDALSTALFNMTLEEGMVLINSTPDAEALWLTPDGEIYMSDGFKRFCR